MLERNTKRLDGDTRAIAWDRAFEALREFKLGGEEAISCRMGVAGCES